MPTTALLLVLTAAVLHAGWNIVAKRSGGGWNFTLMAALLQAPIWAPLALWLAWSELPGWPPQAWALVLASALVHLAYFQVLLHGYRVADLTVVYPVARGTGPLISALAATALLDETLGPRGLAGVMAVVGGVLLIAGGPRLWAAVRGSRKLPAAPGCSAGEGVGGDAAAAAAAKRIKAGVLWGAATGVLIAGYTLVDGYAVKVLLLSPILVDYFGNLLRIPFLLPRALRNRAQLRADWEAQWRSALVLAVVSPVAYVMVLYAAQMAPLSRVAPAREVSMLVAALIGGSLLGEGDRGWRLAGAAALVLGVVLLAG